MLRKERGERRWDKMVRRARNCLRACLAERLKREQEVRMSRRQWKRAACAGKTYVEANSHDRPEIVRDAHFGWSALPAGLPSPGRELVCPCPCKDMGWSGPGTRSRALGHRTEGGRRSQDGLVAVERSGVRKVSHLGTPFPTIAARARYILARRSWGFFGGPVAGIEASSGRAFRVRFGRNALHAANFNPTWSGEDRQVLRRGDQWGASVAGGGEGGGEGTRTGGFWSLRNGRWVIGEMAGRQRQASGRVEQYQGGAGRECGKEDGRRCERHGAHDDGEQGEI